VRPATARPPTIWRINGWGSGTGIAARPPGAKFEAIEFTARAAQRVIGDRIERRGRTAHAEQHEDVGVLADLGRVAQKLDQARDVAAREIAGLFEGNALKIDGRRESIRSRRFQIARFGRFVRDKKTERCDQNRQHPEVAAPPFHLPRVGKTTHKFESVARHGAAARRRLPVKHTVYIDDFVIFGDPGTRGSINRFPEPIGYR